MAFVWKHPQSRFWYARFLDKDGRRRNRSTGTANRKEALKIAESYEALFKKHHTVRQVRKTISDLQREITGEELGSQSFRFFSSSWLERRQGEVANSTLAFYKKTQVKFIEFLGNRADDDIAQITAADILKFRSYLVSKISPKTINHNIKGLRMIFKAAKQEQLLSDNPTESVQALKITKDSNRRPFTQGEISSLLSIAGPEWQSLIRFGLYTGQRLGDIASLTWGNIDMEKREIRLQTRKTGKALLLPIADPLYRTLLAVPERTRLNPRTPLHPSAWNAVMKNGSTGALSNQFGDLLAEAGLRPKLSRTKNPEGRGRSALRSFQDLSFHCLRHTAVTWLKEADVPMAVVMEMIGHDSEQMSRHYTHVGKESLERAVRVLPEL